MIRNDFESQINSHIDSFIVRYRDVGYSRIDYPEFRIFIYPERAVLIMPIYKFTASKLFYCIVFYNFSTMKFVNERVLLSSTAILNNSFRLEELLGE